MPIVRKRIDGRIARDSLASRPVFYFDLEPALACAGPTMLRNPNRLEIVCDHCVNSVTQCDDMIFAGTGFYLIVNSCDEPQASQLASQISASLLKCFFGTGEPPTEALKVLFRRPTEEEFVHLAGTGVGAIPVTTVKVTAVEQPELRGDAPAGKSDDTDLLRELSANGVNRSEGFRFGFAPVHDLRRGTLPTFFCETVRLNDPKTPIERGNVSSIGSREFPRYDQAMLLHALTFSRRLNDAGIIAAVGVSVSFETLAWPKGRQYYWNALRAANCAENPFLIVRIDMIPPGTPHARLAELVAAVRAETKRVFVHLPDDGLNMLQDARLGAAGYVLSSRAGMTNEEVSARAIRLANLCNTHQALSCIDRIPDRRTAVRVHAAGVRLGEGNFLDSKYFFDETPTAVIKAYQGEIRNL
jgi:hypothetical protein